MGLFGESFDKKVAGAIAKISSMGLGVTNLNATIADKVVTLTGEVNAPEVKGRVMEEFNALVDTENTINQIRVNRPAPVPVPMPTAPGFAEAMPKVAAAIAFGQTPGSSPRIHEVMKGETLSKISKQYYGDGNKYPKIFEANRDILDNPDLIKPGQKLRIPE